MTSQPLASLPCPPGTATVPCPRRVLLLDADGGLERAFDCDAVSQNALARELAQSHPGRWVAAEWLLTRRDGSTAWQRHLSVHYHDGKPPEMTGSIHPHEASA